VSKRPGTQTLLSVILVLVVWVGYWIAIFVSDAWSYSNVITLINLIAGVVSLIYVFIRVQSQTASPSSLTLYIYLVGLLLISVAAANYVGASGRVIVDFVADRPINQVQRIGTAALDAYQLRIRPAGKLVHASLTAEEFNTTERFEVMVGEHVVSVSKTAAQRQADPGLGQRYRFYAQ
jgi:hypothetical protein